jgi:hypothetical protein
MVRNMKFLNLHFISNHQNSHSDHVSRESFNSSLINIAQLQNCLVRVILIWIKGLLSDLIQFFDLLHTQLKRYIYFKISLDFSHLFKTATTLPVFLKNYFT